MPTPAELLLPAGAIAFYLYDSLVLVHDDERLLEWREARWQPASPSDVVWLRRRVHLPNPLWPLAPLVLIHPPTHAAACAEAQPGPGFGGALPWLQCLTALLALLLLLVLPVVSLRFGTSLPLLVVFAAYYALLLVTVASLVLLRTRLRLERGALWRLVADLLLCPPFAVNLVRRLSLRPVFSRSVPLPEGLA